MAVTRAKKKTFRAIEVFCLFNSHQFVLVRRLYKNDSVVKILSDDLTVIIVVHRIDMEDQGHDPMFKGENIGVDINTVAFSPISPFLPKDISLKVFLCILY